MHELALYQGVMHPQHHNLYFVGLVMGMCSLWPFAEQQAEWVAAHLCDRVALPDSKKIGQLSQTAHAVSLNTLNCQFSAEALRKDRRV